MNDVNILGNSYVGGGKIGQWGYKKQKNLTILENW